MCIEALIINFDAGRFVRKLLLLILALVDLYRSFDYSFLRWYINIKALIINVVVGRLVAML